MTISADALIRLLIFFLYIPACPILYWALVLRLPRSFRWLATLVLAVQVIVVGISLLYSPASAFEKWLWYLDSEWNIPSLLSSAQLALVSAVALIAGWRVRRQPAWLRGLLFGYGILFLAIAIVEFVDRKGSVIGPWYLPYLILGVSLAAITLVAIESLPKPARLWLLYLFVAFMLIGLAAIVVDNFDEMCDTLVGFFRFDGCLEKNLAEEVMELIGGWLALAALLGQFSEFEPKPSVRIRWTLFLIPVIWILLITQVYTLTPVSQQTGMQGASAVFESGGKLHAFSIKRSSSSATINSYLSFSPGDFKSQGYSVHLVDPISKESIVGADKVMINHLRFRMGPGYTPTHLQYATLRIPPNAPRNHALWIILSLWRADGAEYRTEAIRSSDLPLLGDTQVILGEIVLPAESSPPPPLAPLANFENGFALDPVTLPNEAQAGATLNLHFTWRADSAVDEEYAQFLHLGEEASGQWWIFDQHPLGQRLPTQFWYAGLADTEVWDLTLPADLPPGQYSLYTGLYRSSDKERLPASDHDGTPFVDARVPLGHFNILGAD